MMRCCLLRVMCSFFLTFQFCPIKCTISRGLKSSAYFSGAVSTRQTTSLDREEISRKFREPPGYVAPHRWLIQRPADERLSDLLFESNRITKNLSEENRFLATNTQATLSGVPTTTQNFSYEEINTISDVPQLDHRLHENLSRMGLDHLTPVQRHAISIMSVDEVVKMGNDAPEDQRVVGKYDLMAAAQTGSGKTLAYLIPMVNRLLRVYPYEAMQSRLKSQCQFPSGLILAPTRELVQQILSEVAKLCYRSFLRPVSLFGGERPPRQLHQVSLGCHLVVATPGRLLDFLHQNALRLDHCRALVLDEADRMLDMGFEEQLREILEAPQFGMPPPKESERQTCLYSATFPREVTLLARSFLRGQRCISLTLCDPSEESGIIVPDWGKTARRASSDDEINRLSRIIPREITQKFEEVTENHRDALVEYLIQRVKDITDRHTSSDTTETNDDSEASSRNIRLGQEPRILIFCNTKREVDLIDGAFNRRNFRSAAIHGDKAQVHRSRVLDWFRRGRINILVASSVAARGLDIPDVRAVINVGLPLEVDDYVHRIGRTGRMGHAGEAITVISDDLLQRSSRSVARGILRLAERSLDTMADVPESLLQLSQWNSRRGEDSDESDETARRQPRQKPGYLSRSGQFKDSDRNQFPYKKRPHGRFDR